MLKLNERFKINGVRNKSFLILNIDYQTNLVKVEITYELTGDYEVQHWNLINALKQFQTEHYYYI